MISGLNIDARDTPEGCCAMITERIACTKRARLAGMALACVSPLALNTSSGTLWPESGASGLAGAIGDGESVLRDSERLYGDVRMVEQGA
jgi:hypothetical protein